MPNTVSDLIHSSFRLIGAIAAGETLETNELNDAFISLNQLVSLWNTEGAMVVGRTRFTLSVGGTNGPYPLPARPMRIEAASVASGGIDSELKVATAAEWETAPEKQMQSVYVKLLYCDYAYPNSSVYIAPIPRLGGTLEMWAWTGTAIPQFTATTQAIDLPPGYEEALRYNFAVNLLPEYPRTQVDPTLVPQAQAYKASIMQLNTANHAPPAAAAPVAPAA